MLNNIILPILSDLYLNTCGFVIISLQRYLFRPYPFKVGVILISFEISSHLRW